MKKFVIVFVMAFLALGCNIMPKSVQYQKEEDKLIGNVDVINPIVEEIQVVLKRLGYETGNTDGRMGSATRHAIKEFQESKGIKSTGYIDKLTLEQVEDVRRVVEAGELKDSYKIEVRSPYSKTGDSKQKLNIDIKDIQSALKNAGFDPGAIDGKMGPATRQAVKEFQKTKGLTPDGKVGPKTWDALSKHLKK